MVRAIFAVLNLNHVNKLRTCLNSLLNQLDRDFLIIVVDGGSTDGSIELLNEYSNKHSNIGFFIQRKRGIGNARNEFLDYAQSNHLDPEMILWGDSEQSYDLNYVRNMTRINADVVGGANIIKSEKPLSQALWWLYCGIDGKGIMGHSILIRHEVYSKYGIVYPMTVTMDDYFVLNDLVASGIRFARSPDALCYVTTAESCSEFLSWHRRKRKGLVQGLTESSDVSRGSAFRFAMVDRTFRTYSIFAFLIFSSIVISLLFSGLSLLVLALLFCSLFSLSAYLWVMGRHFVTDMRKTTFFLVTPIFLYHYTSILLTLLINSLWRIFKINAKPHEDE